jgi:hypothetical protein
MPFGSRINDALPEVCLPSGGWPVAFATQWHGRR